mmetsp:Transcript_22026/g.61221  ORF Transcript_22026/g.61221 Transcript_22026/m.61221 type:complete len:191 (+) Transcript_22026:439-1011(+)
MTTTTPTTLARPRLGQKSTLCVTENGKPIHCLTYFVGTTTKDGGQQYYYHVQYYGLKKFKRVSPKEFWNGNDRYKNQDKFWVGKVAVVDCGGPREHLVAQVGQSTGVFGRQKKSILVSTNPIPTNVSPMSRPTFPRRRRLRPLLLLETKRRLLLLVTRPRRRLLLLARRRLLLVARIRHRKTQVGSGRVV